MNKKPSMWIKKTFLVGFIITLIVAVCSAKTYHVAVKGKDSNSGSLQAPFRSIQKAADVMSAGDTCFIHAGTYYESVKPANSGSQGSPLVFSAFLNDQVVIHGGKIVKGWTKFHKNIFKTPIADTVKEVFVNGQLMLLARHPNMPYDPIKGFDMLRPKMGTANPPSNVDWTGVIVFKTRGMKQGEGNYNNVWKQNEYVKLSDSIAGGGWLMGVPGLLDSEGEWCWKEGILYLWAPGGKNPDPLFVEAKVRDLGIDLSERSYIVLNNITVFSATVSMNGAMHCIMDGCRIFHPSSKFDVSTYNTIALNRFAPITPDLQGKGILVNGSDNIIQNCEIAHSWGNCLTILGSGNKVYNCEIYDANWEGWECGAISMNGGGHIIRRNSLHDSQRVVLEYNNVVGMTPLSEACFIDSNDIYNSGLAKTDNGVIKTFYTNGNGTVISYNWIHDGFNGYSTTLHSTGGIYLDDYSSNFIVHHNVIWNQMNGATATGIRANNPKPGYPPNCHQIYNNTIWNCRRAINSPYKDWNGNTGVPYWNGTKVFNNILLKEVDFGPATVGNNYSASNPMFTDTANLDFRPKAGSPCIDAGTVYPASPMVMLVPLPTLVLMNLVVFIGNQGGFPTVILSVLKK